MYSSLFQRTDPSSAATDDGKAQNMDPFLRKYDAKEVRVAAELLSTWLPFLTRGLCESCSQTLSDGVGSLHRVTEGCAAVVTPNTVDVIPSKEDPGNCSAHSTGSSADNCEDADRHSVGSWGNEADQSSGCATVVTPNTVDVIPCKEDPGNCSAHSTGSSADNCEDADRHSVGSWGNEADQSSGCATVVTPNTVDVIPCKEDPGNCSAHSTGSSADNCEDADRHSVGSWGNEADQSSGCATVVTPNTVDVIPCKEDPGNCSAHSTGSSADNCEDADRHSVGSWGNEADQSSGCATVVTPNTVDVIPCKEDPGNCSAHSTGSSADNCEDADRHSVGSWGNEADQSSGCATVVTPNTVDVIPCKEDPGNCSAHSTGSSADNCEDADRHSVGSWGNEADQSSGCATVVTPNTVDVIPCKEDPGNCSAHSTGSSADNCEDADRHSVGSWGNEADQSSGCATVVTPNTVDVIPCKEDPGNCSAHSTGSSADNCEDADRHSVGSWGNEADQSSGCATVVTPNTVDVIPCKEDPGNCSAHSTGSSADNCEDADRHSVGSWGNEADQSSGCATVVTPNTVDVIPCKEDPGNCSAHSTGSSADNCDDVDKHSVGSSGNEADQSSGHPEEPSSTPETLNSAAQLTSPGLKKSWADMAMEDEVAAEEQHHDGGNGLVDASDSFVEGTSNVDVKPKRELSRDEREYIRFSYVQRKKDFICLERVKGKVVNILDGLELHKGIFSAAEQKRIVNYVEQLREMGKDGQLKERTYSAPQKWMRGKGRITLQFGCCYNYATDKDGNPPGILKAAVVDPLPQLFKVMIKRLIRWHVLPPSCVPDSCIVNIYEEGDCIPPHIDNPEFVRPFCTVSFLSECDILFGSNLKIKGPGEFEGSFAIPLPLGSVLVLQGNGADVAKHCVPAVPSKRISITFRRMDESRRPIGYTSEPDLQGLQPLPDEDDSSASRSRPSSIGPAVRREDLTNTGRDYKTENGRGYVSEKSNPQYSGRRQGPPNGRKSQSNFNN